MRFNISSVSKGPRTCCIIIQDEILGITCDASTRHPVSGKGVTNLRTINLLYNSKQLS